MSRLFGREVSITFGKLGEDGVNVEKLRILFKIKKTSEKTPNSGEIKIYNLNPNNRAKLEATKDLIIILEAGYSGILEYLFSGNITKAKTVKQGSDFITTITAGDGDKAFTEARLDKSYAAGTHYKQMFEDLMETMKEVGNIALGSLDNIKDEITQNGITLSGLSNVLLSKLADKQGLEWSIQDNELQILKALSSSGRESVLLTPETGLIGRPVKLDEGIEFKSLLNTKILPGGLIQIASEALVENILVKEVTFEGDTHGAPFFVSGIGVAI